MGGGRGVSGAGRRGAALLLLVVCGLGVYGNSLDNAFQFDDEHTIVRNPHIRSLRRVPSYFIDPAAFSGLSKARMYRPLVVASYAVNYAVGGYSVRGYHLVNLILHLLNAFVLWRLLEQMTGEGAASLAGALLFLVHPLMGEPVNYISSRASLMAALAVLGALYMLRLPRREGSLPRTLAAAGALMLGLLSKSAAAVMPLMAGAGWLVGGARRRWREWALLVLVVVAYVWITRDIVAQALLRPTRPLSVQAATQIKAWAFYVLRVIMPVGLSVEPQFSAATRADAFVVLGASLWLGSLAWLSVRARRTRPLLAVAAWWFASGLLPASIVPLHVLVCDHRLYLSMAGVAVAWVAFYRDTPVTRRWTWWVLAGVFGISCMLRNPVWRDPVSLWEEAVREGPRMARAHVNLGRAYLEKGDLPAAVHGCRQALLLDPDLALAHYDLATAYLRQGRPDLAVPYYQRALECQPDLSQARNNLANAYLELGRPRDAVSELRRALQAGVSAPVLHNLAGAYLEACQLDSARRYFARAVALDPALREAYVGWAQAGLRAGLLDEARQVLRRGLSRWPADRGLLLLSAEEQAQSGDLDGAFRSYVRTGMDSTQAWVTVGDHARARGRYAQASSLYRRALDRDPDDAAALDGLAQVLYLEGRTSEALQTLRRAARAAPSRARPYVLMGRIYLREHHPLEAAAALQRAVRLSPDEGEPCLYLGAALEAQGKDSAAVKVYQTCLERIGKGDTLRAEIDHRLRIVQGRSSGASVRRP